MKRGIVDPSKVTAVKPCWTCQHYQAGHCYAAVPHPETGSRVFSEAMLAEHIRMNYCHGHYHNIAR